MTIYNLIKKPFIKFRNLSNRVVRHYNFKKIRKEFNNRSLSVFSSNCVGCLMLHDLGLRFNSPFVNLYLDAKDFLKFLNDPHKYCSAEFHKVKTDLPYPVATLNDLTIHFVHYTSYDEAVNSFKKRCERINYDDLFVIFSERDGCSYEDLKEFDSLPYKNKVVFTHLPYEEIKSSYYIEGFENECEIGNILKWDKKMGRKIYDRFDFVTWLRKN